MKFFYLVCIGFFLICTSCNVRSYYMPDPFATPPPSAKVPETIAFSLIEPTVAPVIPDKGESLSLSDLVDIALQNSPLTRQKWFQAKEAATNVGTARGAYLPAIQFEANYESQRFIGSLSSINATTVQQNWGYSLSTSYLLFDFGGRNANIKEALAALDAADWTYSWEIQTVIITTVQNYYKYINALEVLKADKANLRDNQETLDATVALKVAGVQSLAHELQARTNLLQTQISLEEDIGQLNIAYATLVQSLGLPPDTPLCIANLPDVLCVDPVCTDAASILLAAKQSRADLMSLRATVLQNRAQIGVEQSNMFPTLNTDISSGREWVNNFGSAQIYSASIILNWKIFNSFSDVNALRNAYDTWQAAQAELDQEELEAFLAVLSDYYTFVADTDVLKTSYEYYNVALKNQQLTFANFVAGIATFIDLSQANESLNDARLQLANAKTNWLTSIANLAYDTGGLTFESINEDQTVTPELLVDPELLFEPDVECCNEIPVDYVELEK